MLNTTAGFVSTVNLFVDNFQLRMMQAELNVEEIVRDRSLKVIWKRYFKLQIISLS